MQGQAGSSIPVDYKTIVVKDTESKGFASTAKRFASQKHDLPGPGVYNATTGFTELPSSVSQSRTGTGAFVSKASRFVGVDHAIETPSPASYQLLTAPRTAVGVGEMRVFRTALAVTKDKVVVAPAPNSYEVSTAVSSIDTRHNTTAACFKSRTARGQKLSQPASIRDNLPGPTVYNPSTTATDARINSSFAAVFKSATARGMMLPGKHNPPPGAYEITHGQLQVPKARTTPRMFHVHHNTLSSPALKMPPVPESPGPAQYNVAPNIAAERRMVSSSIFVSSTPQTQAYGKLEKERAKPGPGAYNPSLPTIKDSFHYNPNAKWVAS